MRMVEGDCRVTAFFTGGFLQCFHQLHQDFAGQIPSAPVEHKRKVLPDCHLRTFADILDFGKGELVLTVIETVAAGTGGDWIDYRLMVPEKTGVIQIEVVVSDEIVLSQGVIKGGVQMKILSAQSKDVPGVAVFDPLFRIGFRNCDDAPEAQGVTEDLNGFRDPLADAHSLSQRADDLVGIRLV